MLPPAYYQRYKVFVHLTDINDHAPTFHEDLIQLNITESTQPGARFSLPAADDSDSEKYAVIEYRLEPSEMQRIFTVDVVTEADGSQRVSRHVTYLFTYIIAYLILLVNRRTTAETLVRSKSNHISTENIYRIY